MEGIFLIETSSSEQGRVARIPINAMTPNPSAAVSIYCPSPDDAFAFEPPQTLVNGRRCQFHQRRKILKTLRGILLQCLEQDEIFSVQVH
jgi:hypothetical protein